MNIMLVYDLICFGRPRVALVAGFVPSGGQDGTQFLQW